MAKLQQDALEKYLEWTATPKGEIDLMNRYLSGDEEACEWFDALKEALHSSSDNALHTIGERPFVAALRDLTHRVLIPQIDNFTPPERTPWGGYGIIERLKIFHGVDTDHVVGESWELSGHKSFPNLFTGIYEDMPFEVSLQVLEDLFPQELFGKHHRKMPFLVKYLSSGSWTESIEKLRAAMDKFEAFPLLDNWKTDLGIEELDDILNKNYHDLHSALRYLTAEFEEDHAPTYWMQLVGPVREIHKKMLCSNLSIQVHPRPGDYPDKPSKTEAWVILSAEAGAGIYLGLKEGVSQNVFEKCLNDGGDVADLLNFVEVKEGDVFFIPSGTLHAIGAGVLLLEAQESSESTFRAYDWGRLVDGKPRKMHVEETLHVTYWDGYRGDKLIKDLRREPKLISRTSSGGASLEQLIDSDIFKLFRLHIGEGEEVLGDNNNEGIQGFLVVEGAARFQGADESQVMGCFHAGQSVLLPSSIKSFSIKSMKKQTILYQVSSK